MYRWITLQTRGDLDQLATSLGPEYDPQTVVDVLKDGISDGVKGILIEENYVDKDYRSTYYHFYAKHGQRYSPQCVRLHFFGSRVVYRDDGFELKSTDGRVTDDYFGYMVLRPTGVSTIGRTVLSPSVRKGGIRTVITASHKAHVLGYKLMVEGFPWMNQHTDISVCAHTACWSILRHYSERWTHYREFLTHDITLMAHDFDPGGLLPSRGLYVGHAERVFSEAGMFPLHIARESPNDQAFFRQLMAYVDSGFPVFAAMETLQHAVVVNGYELAASSRTPPAGQGYAWDYVGAISVVDDNYLPYLSIPTTGLAGDPGYTADDIDAFIVALPEKIYYPADAVERVLPRTYMMSALVDLPPADQSVVRYFTTTASGLRSFVRDHSSEYAPDLIKTIMELPFAQFLWIIEYSTREQWATGQIEARAILDGSASVQEKAPLWLLHNRQTAAVFDRRFVAGDSTASGTLDLAPMGHSGFSRMEQNLRPQAPPR